MFYFDTLEIKELIKVRLRWFGADLVKLIALLLIKGFKRAIYQMKG